MRSLATAFRKRGSAGMHHDAIDIVGFLALCKIRLFNPKIIEFFFLGLNSQ